MNLKLASFTVQIVLCPSTTGLCMCFDKIWTLGGAELGQAQNKLELELGFISYDQPNVKITVIVFEPRIG